MATCTFALRRMNERLFLGMSLMEKRAKRFRDHFAWTFLGDRSVQEKCTKRIPTALYQRRLSCFFLFSHQVRHETGGEPPMTVVLSPISASVTDADTCLCS